MESLGTKVDTHPLALGFKCLRNPAAHPQVASSPEPQFSAAHTQALPKAPALPRVVGTRPTRGSQSFRGPGLHFCEDLIGITTPRPKYTFAPCTGCPAQFRGPQQCHVPGGGKGPTAPHRPHQREKGTRQRASRDGARLHPLAAWRLGGQRANFPWFLHLHIRCKGGVRDAIKTNADTIVKI